MPPNVALQQGVCCKGWLEGARSTQDSLVPLNSCLAIGDMGAPGPDRVEGRREQGRQEE